MNFIRHVGRFLAFIFVPFWRAVGGLVGLMLITLLWPVFALVDIWNATRDTKQ